MNYSHLEAAILFALFSSVALGVSTTGRIPRGALRRSLCRQFCCGIGFSCCGIGFGKMLWDSYDVRWIWIARPGTGTVRSVMVAVARPGLAYRR
jgi:hypothetical protein